METKSFIMAAALGMGVCFAACGEDEEIFNAPEDNNPTDTTLVEPQDSIPNNQTDSTLTEPQDSIPNNQTDSTLTEPQDSIPNNQTDSTLTEPQDSVPVQPANNMSEEEFESFIIGKQFRNDDFFYSEEHASFTFKENNRGEYYEKKTTHEAHYAHDVPTSQYHTIYFSWRVIDSNTIEIADLGAFYHYEHRGFTSDDEDYNNYGVISSDSWEESTGAIGILDIDISEDRNHADLKIIDPAVFDIDSHYWYRTTDRVSFSY